MQRPRQAVDVHSECVPNITARGRDRRLFKGMCGAAIAAGIFAAFFTNDAPIPMYLVVLPFVAYSAICFFQAKEKT